MGEAAATTRKRERREARVSPEQKALFERAARLQGRSLTAFMMAHCTKPPAPSAIARC